VKKIELNVLPAEHPWCMPIIQLVVDDTNRRLALGQSVFHHLKPTDDNMNKQSFFIHCQSLFSCQMEKVKKEDCSS
jgi:hypothetical protein